METVIGVKALKDKWMRAKLKSGDLRGMTHNSRFVWGRKFGITDMETAFNSIAPKHGKVEIEASVDVDEKS